MLAPVRVTPPATTPVSLAEAKAHLRVTDDGEDDLITAYIAAAASHLDGWSGTLGRALITQVWRLDLASFSDPIRLPLGPVQSVDSITYYDTDDVQQTLDEADYGLWTDARGAFVARSSVVAWPSLYSRRDAVSVTWTAGYGAAADVPAPIKQSILLLVSHWYEQRSAVNVGNIVTPIPMAVDALLAPYRVWRG